MKKNWVGFAIVCLSGLMVFLIFCKKEYEILHYFLPLSNSILHGKLDVNCSHYLNELVLSQSKCYIVYPPMPAILLLPFTAVFGMKLSQVFPAIIYASLAGGFFYLFLKKFLDKKSSLLLSFLLLFGTNFFLTSLIGRSWYFSHVSAVFFLAIALNFACPPEASPSGDGRRAASRRLFLAGLFLGFAGLSRLPLFLAFPAVLYLLKPKNKDVLKFFLSLSLSAIIYLLYNWVRFGNILETGYDLIPGVLSEPWFKEGIFSLNYIPRNLEAMLWSFPDFFNKFPFFVPSTDAMALWLVTPAILFLPLALKNKQSLVMIGTFLLVLMPSLMHGSVGFSQFGYRFALDGILLLIAALIPVAKTYPKILFGGVVISIAINLYVVLQFTMGIFKP